MKYVWNHNSNEISLFRDIYEFKTYYSHISLPMSLIPFDWTGLIYQHYRVTKHYHVKKQFGLAFDTSNQYTKLRFIRPHKQCAQLGTENPTMRSNYVVEVRPHKESYALLVV